MSKKPHIVLHRDYGLNETRIICFWCGEESGVRIVMGNKVDHQAPKTMITGYDPCDTCEEKISKGIQIIEYQETPVSARQFAMVADLFPTGRWMVIGREAFDEMFDREADEEVYRLILKCGMALLTKDVYEKILEHYQTDGVGVSLADMEVGGHA